MGSNPLSVAVVYCLPSCHALSCFNYHSHTWPPTLHLRMCATNPPKSPSLHRRSVCAAKSSIVETCLAVCGAAIFLLENDSSGLSKAKIFSGAPPPTPRIQDPSPDARPRHPCHPSPPQASDYTVQSLSSSRSSICQGPVRSRRRPRRSIDWGCFACIACQG